MNMLTIANAGTHTDCLRSTYFYFIPFPSPILPDCYCRPPASHLSWPQLLSGHGTS